MMRWALELHKLDRNRCAFRANGEVVLQRVRAIPTDENPALSPFLTLLEQDIAAGIWFA